jgi:NAD(P)-dependent dehydrogenase (short-subunit alcohol dehydrogenase family)
VKASGICAGQVAVVTGAGRGIGREHALEFARQGARVVVNDLGAEVDGTGSSEGPAGEVVDQIRSAGGEAIANGDDVADWEGAARLIGSAVGTWGRLDILVCNAGILRDRMIVSLNEAEWDAVIRVHLKGTFCPVHHAATHWRELAKAGEAVDASIVCTSSGAGLYGNVGQANYATAKAGLCAFTRVAAAELGRYGVRANAIAPAARSRMTESLFPEMMARPEHGFDAMDAANIAPLVVWLGSTESAGVTGRVFELTGGKISVAEGWEPGPHVDKGDRWDPAELTPVIADLVARAPAPVRVIGS